MAPQIQDTSSAITASHLLEYLYCPRFTYFEYVLDIPEYQDKRFKVQKGREVHDKVRKTNVNYLRKKLGAIRKESNVYLSSSIGRGIVDEILFLEDGSASPLDFKYAEFKNRIFQTYKYQLTFYAQLIKDNFNLPVNRGYIIYTRSKNKLIELDITSQDFDKLDKKLKNLIDVILRNKYPKPTRDLKKCVDCCYKNICEKSI